MRISLRLNNALNDILEKDKSAILIGEDIKDPYGGAFKVTKDLTKKFSKQIIQTPISEAGFVGMATGMILKGINPIVEIMFNDFLALISDIVINSSTKIPELTTNKKNLGKLLIRTPGGGGRGYGPIHSQNLEKIFFGFPNLEIISQNILIDPYKALIDTYDSEFNVKIFLENKLDYAKEIVSNDFLIDNGFSSKILSERLETKILSNSKNLNEPDIFIICYGGTTERTILAAKKLLLEEEITSSIIVPSKIYPADNDLKKYLSIIQKPVLIVEDGYNDNGWGSYILYLFSKLNNFLNFKKVQLIGPEKSIIPASIEKEKKHFIQVEDIVRETINLLL
jgi:pyruvate/2-oxoglutarate/acetoin dehydrogenase E1 component